MCNDQANWYNRHFKSLLFLCIGKFKIPTQFCNTQLIAADRGQLCCAIEHQGLVLSSNCTPVLCQPLTILLSLHSPDFGGLQFYSLLNLDMGKHKVFDFLCELFNILSSSSTFTAKVPHPASPLSSPAGAWVSWCLCADQSMTLGVGP